MNYITDGNGTVEGEARQTVEYGKDSSLVTAIPNEGYEFVSWSDGVTTATRQEKEVKQDYTVTATFKKKVYQIKYRTNDFLLGLLRENGVSYDVIRLDFEVAYGENAPIVRALPNKNDKGEKYVFLYWSDGVTTEERQETNITGDVTITAIFGYRV